MIGTAFLMRNQVVAVYNRVMLDAVDEYEARRLVAAHPWWYQRFEIFRGVMTPGVYDPSELFHRLNFPADMTGKTVLEIGTADGYFAKMLDLRGADVTATDYCRKDLIGFALMERLHGRPMRFVNTNLYDIDRHGFAPFDFVLCLGVLYHLPDMVRALWLLRPYVKGELLLETYVSRKHEDKPIAEYLPARTCNNDISNFWAPNIKCVSEMLKDCGYTITEQFDAGERAFFRARVSGEGQKVELAYSGIRLS